MCFQNASVNVSYDANSNEMTGEGHSDFRRKGVGVLGND